MSRTEYRTCPLCEATCGIELAINGETVLRIRGDRNDVFSNGFICPKGTTLGKLHDDPDRLRKPLVRRGGELVETDWETAFAAIAQSVAAIDSEHGRDAFAVYLGNPNVHNMSSGFYVRPLLRAIRTRNIFSASTVDQMPKHVSSGMLFGHPDLIPVPDIDRIDFLLILGADPYESNGSLATAPDWPGRMEAITERGGTVVVVDPRRSRTAKAAGEHLFIRPGTDVALLLALMATLYEEGLVSPHPAGLLDGVEDLAAAVAEFSAETVAEFCRIDAATIRGLARRLAAAESAAVYGRIGTHTTGFGTLASWAVDALNILTGNLDRPGGAMFPLAAIAVPKSTPGGRGFKTGRFHSRVSGHPEVRSELPVAALAEEIDTPGDGQVRVLITVAGNPERSTPDTERLEVALAGLDFMVSLDPYLNETTCHADVVLPPPSVLERPHFDLAFTSLMVRNTANYTPVTFEKPADQPHEWQIVLRLTAIFSGVDTSVEQLDRTVAEDNLSRALANPSSPAHGVDPETAWTQMAEAEGPDRLLDIRLRTGPYGDGFVDGAGMSLATLQKQPHGVDLGALEPRLPEALQTPDGQIKLFGETIAGEFERLAAVMRLPAPDVTLIGRRHVRSNNSWMHNIEVLVRGKQRCTLLLSEHDADVLGVKSGDDIRVTSRVGTVDAPVEVTANIMPGVVSLPHGWGHNVPGSRMQVAATHAGVNSNALTDAAVIDPLSGNAALNAIPVTLSSPGLS